MIIEFTSPEPDELQELIDIRLAAMKPSLVAIGRYDPKRATERFVSSYDPAVTNCIVLSGQIIGFYVLIHHDDHLLLNHLYIQPESQGQGYGSLVLDAVKQEASS